METLMQLDFCTIVCNGCGMRIDSLVDGERVFDKEELEESILENGWTEDGSCDGRFLCKGCSEDESNRKYPGEGRTIVEPEKLFGVRCDLCGKEYCDENDTGFTHWEDESYAIEKAKEDDWRTIDGNTYCGDCWYCDDDSDVEHVREKPIASEECPINCPYFSKDSLHYHCSLSRTGEETEKCKRLIDWKEKKREIEEKNLKIEENVKNHSNVGK